MSEEPHDTRPSIHNARINWRESALPFFTKLRMTLANNWTKVRTRQNCCGNFGQPGC